MNRSLSLSVSSAATQVSSEVGVGLCNSSRTRSRSLDDLPGGLRVPLLKRPERLKPRIQATLAGLEELRLLKEQHRNLVDEAKFGLKTRSVSNSDMQDLFVKQTYDWLSSCRERLSVSNLERISEESGKEEKNTATLECTHIKQRSSDSIMPTRYRCQIKRPLSVSGYPTMEQSRRSAELSHNFKSNQQLERTNPRENEKPFKPEKLTTMRRASFQCHVVLTKQKGSMPPMSASHEYPSPMHAVMRQYQSKIDDDKEKNNKNDKTESSRDGTGGVTVIRRSSFTARSSSRTNNQNSLSSSNSSSTRRRSNHETTSSLHGKGIDTRSHCSAVSDEASNRLTGDINKVDVTGSISHRKPFQGIVRDSSVMRRETSSQKCNKELEVREVTDSSQTSGQTSVGVGISKCLNPNPEQQQVNKSIEKSPIEHSGKSEKYSEYQNLRDLEQQIWKAQAVHSNNPKQPDNHARSPTQLTVMEKGKNLLNFKGDSCSYTSDEGYCASLSSTPSGRRQLSIQSDASWISADIEDSRSCDTNVISYKSGCSSHITHGAHVRKLDRKSSLSRCNNSIITPRNEKLHASKVLPFRQTSL